jgi:hypothetical protein
VTWQSLARELEKLRKSGAPKQRVISQDLLAYMKAHHMTRERKSVEIYAREINEPLTLEMFLKAQIYGCKYDKNSRLGEALYFAPHFSRSITNAHPGVSVGISYVAQIGSVGRAANWQEFRKLATDERGAFWWNRHRAVLQQQLRQRWKWEKGQHRSFLFLGAPHLVFNPPVHKERLQRGRGWLSKRFFSFEELFVAWGR